MTAPVSRREFLKVGATAALGAALAPSLLAATSAEQNASTPGDLDFVFFTDTHLQPELMAQEGCAMCFKKIAALKPEFVICGGDLVFDAGQVPRERAERLFTMYRETERLIDAPLHHAIGNHDMFALKGSPAAGDADYGKKMYQDRVGPTYHSFDQKGYHFIVLDSVHLTPEHEFEAIVDADQLNWLAEDLKKVGPRTPVIITTHVPLVTGILSYSPPRPPSPRPTLIVGNASEVLKVFDGYNVIAVLQGHTHINEEVMYRKTHYITSGAVCGNWWKGPRWGHPEGFTAISLRGGKITHRYETYGFKAQA